MSFLVFDKKDPPFLERGDGGLLEYGLGDGDLLGDGGLLEYDLGEGPRKCGGTHECGGWKL